MKVTKTADGAKVLEQAETDKLLYACEDIGEVYRDGGDGGDDSGGAAYVVSVGMMLCDLGDHIKGAQSK